MDEVDVGVLDFPPVFTGDFVELADHDWLPACSCARGLYILVTTVDWLSLRGQSRMAWRKRRIMNFERWISV